MSFKKMTISQWIVFIILIFLAVSTIYPMLFMAISTLKDRGEYLTNMFGFPSRLYLNNFKIIFDRFNIPRLAMNSFIVTCLSIVISIFITTLASFSFAKLPFKGSSAIFLSVLGCMMIPGQVLLIPIYLTMSKLKLINNYLSLILFYVTTSIPFSTYLLTVNCRGIPGEMIESAKIDGAHIIKIYYIIILPMLFPTITTLAILNFLSYWNELLYAMLFLQTEKLRTMTVAIATLTGRYTTNMPVMMTGLLLSSLPVVIVFLLFQKYIAKGITMGAIK